MEKLLVGGRGVHARTAGHHQRVDRAGDSPIGDEANSRPQLAVTGPPRDGDDVGRGTRTDGMNREALEKTSSGPVTSRICAESKVAMTTRALAHREFHSFTVGRRPPMADIVNLVSLWVNRAWATGWIMRAAL